MFLKEKLFHKKLYPIVADLVYVMVCEVGFKYQEKIIWRKAEGYIRIKD
jgi:site-specific DNA-methyltransferase (adenine-specific)/site-specific DNA-methyltransferase (cytosine-N4-specific)